MTIRTAAACLAALVTTAVLAAPVPAGDPVNTKCPISGNDADGSATVQVGEHTVAVCCGGCVGRFKAWEESAKASFIEEAIAASAVGAAATSDDEAKPIAVPKGDPYPLAVCPVSGEKLGSMGDPIVKKYDGREVRFCCGGCVGRFEGDLKDSMKQLDKKIAKSQRAYYPMNTCVVMGDALTEDGEDIAVEMVWKNRLVRLCCKACVRKFKKEPGKFIAELDKNIIAKQGEKYPIDSCVVSGSELGDSPTEIVVGNRLVRLCCGGCEGKVRENPSKYFAIIDAAWKKNGGLTR
jgi:hypothetical protein